jgi:propanediol utilization protein
MSIKSEGRRLGRNIRRITGIPLPVSLRMGKMIAQDKHFSEFKEKFPDNVIHDTSFCGPGKCCVYSTITFVGPRGSLINPISMREWMNESGHVDT